MIITLSPMAMTVAKQTAADKPVQQFVESLLEKLFANDSCYLILQPIPHPQKLKAIQEAIDLILNRTKVVDNQLVTSDGQVVGGGEEPDPEIPTNPADQIAELERQLNCVNDELELRHNAQQNGIETNIAPLENLRDTLKARIATMRVDIKLSRDQFDEFAKILDKPAEAHPALHKLLTEPSVLEGARGGGKMLRFPTGDTPALVADGPASDVHSGGEVAEKTYSDTLTLSVDDGVPVDENGD